MSNTSHPLHPHFELPPEEQHSQIVIQHIKGVPPVIRTYRQDQLPQGQQLNIFTKPGMPDLRYHLYRQDTRTSQSLFHALIILPSQGKLHPIEEIPEGMMVEETITLGKRMKLEETCLLREATATLLM